MKSKKKPEPLAYQLPTSAVWEPLAKDDEAQSQQAVMPLEALAFTHRAVFDAKCLIPVKK